MITYLFTFKVITYLFTFKVITYLFTFKVITYLFTFKVITYLFTFKVITYLFTFKVITYLFTFKVITYLFLLFWHLQKNGSTRTYQETTVTCIRTTLRNNVQLSREVPFASISCQTSSCLHTGTANSRKAWKYKNISRNN